MNSTRNRQDIFLYEMPAKERFDLCKILDQNNTWVVLAEHMNYGQTDIEVREAFQMTIKVAPLVLTMMIQLLPDSHCHSRKSVGQCRMATRRPRTS